MAYDPPSCDNVEFGFLAYYTPPDPCDQPIFDFIGGLASDVIPHDVEILIEADTSSVFSGFLILPDSMEVPIEIEKSFIELYIEIIMASMEINIELPHVFIEILPDIITANAEIFIEMGISQVKTPETHNLPFGIATGGKTFGWDKETSIHVTKALPYGQGEFIQKQYGTSGNSQIPTGHVYSMGFVALDWKDNSYVCPAGDFSDKLDNKYCSSYVGLMYFADLSYTNPAGDFHIFSNESISFPYLEPGEKDVQKHTAWGFHEEVTKKFCASYNEPGAKDVDKVIPWGPYSYYLLCLENSLYYYTPPTECGVVFTFPSKYDLIEDACSGVIFHINNYSSEPDIRCKEYEHWHSGMRDKFPAIIIGENDNRIIYPSARGIYYMLNQVLVKEIITGKPIEVLSVSATTDRDSWLWQFQITVASRDCLNAIMPVDGTYITIEISINGWKWLCTVESWTENRTFLAQTFNVVGRSPSILYSSPISQKGSNTITTGYQGQQLFEQIIGAQVAPDNWPLSIAEWDADWTQYQISTASAEFDYYTAVVQTGFNPLTDWFIPANTFSYTDLTDIEALQTIATSIGAWIYTDPNDTVIHVRPKFAQQPWNWLPTNSSIKWKTIIEDQCESIGKSSQLFPSYERVFVAGESVQSNSTNDGADSANQAVFVNVYKTGYPNGKLAEAVTDPLITTSKAALERGRMVIGKVGNWYEHTLRLNILCPDPSPMGLFIPGDMVSVLERGVPWYGQVTGVTVTAGRSSEGGAVNVTQVLTIEQYVWG